MTCTKSYQEPSKQWHWYIQQYYWNSVVNIYVFSHLIFPTSHSKTKTPTKWICSSLHVMQNWQHLSVTINWQWLCCPQSHHTVCCRDMLMGSTVSTWHSPKAMLHPPTALSQLSYICFCINGLKFYPKTITYMTKKSRGKEQLLNFGTKTLYMWF